MDAAAALTNGGYALNDYHLFSSVRADLLMKLQRFVEACVEVQRAISITMNLREKDLLEKRLKQIEMAALQD